MPPFTRRRQRLQRIRRNRHRRKLRLLVGQMARRYPEYLRPAGNLYLGRDGWPISFRSWTLHMEDREYRQVLHTRGPDYQVSTIWLGLHMGSDPPLIFETAICRGGPDADGLFNWKPQLRYESEAKARRGHTLFVQLMKMEMHNARARGRREAAG